MHALSYVNELTEEAITRFWSYVSKGDGCWEWTGAKDIYGYGVFFFGKKKSYRAHRIAWIIANGSIPPGKCVCHHCDNPGCPRPDHLFMGTPKDNTLDRISKGRFVLNSHCKKGHLLEEGNIYISRNKRGSYRLCKICMLANNRKYYHRKQARKKLAVSMNEPPR